LTNTSKTSEANGRSLAAVVTELKNDVVQFLQTRYQMLIAEMKEKIHTWKFAVPWLLVAAFLAVNAFLLLTGAAVVLISVAVGVGWSLLIVGVAYLIAAFVSAAVVYGELKRTRMTPQRTLHVLREDKAWLQKEAKSA
jgi:uncharacterized membrane protein YqjE